jgi:hypothetical protein
MEKINNKIQLYIKLILFLMILILLIYYTSTSKDIVVVDILYQIPKAISIYYVAGLIFSKWFWKWNIWKGWLVNVPNLQGTWKGFLKSDWIDPETKQGVEKIPIFLTIKQNLDNISCEIMTKESGSYSLSADILYINKKLQFSYTYNNIPRSGFRDRSQIHNGASLLKIINKPSKKLIGEYWTDRKTRGEIDLEFFSNDIIEEFTS